MLRITEVLDYVRRPGFKRKLEHDVSETGSVWHLV
jgi:hypothetical protein